MNELPDQTELPAQFQDGPLPGGYALFEKVYFVAASETTSNGDKLTHGQAGEVNGPATSRTHVGKGVAVMFSGNERTVDCYVTQLSRRAPPPESDSNDTEPSSIDPALRRKVSLSLV